MDQNRNDEEVRLRDVFKRVPMSAEAKGATFLYTVGAITLGVGLVSLIGWNGVWLAIAAWCFAVGLYPKD